MRGAYDVHFGEKLKKHLKNYLFWYTIKNVFGSSDMDTKILMKNERLEEKEKARICIVFREE